MGQYRLLQPAYMQRQPGPPPVWDVTGRVAAFRPGAPFELLAEGQTVMSDVYPGPFVEAMDAGAKEAEAEYRKKRPGASLDPTRHLPNGQDPMMMQTFEGLMLRSLEGMLSEIPAKPAQNDVLTSIADNQAVMTAAITQLAQTVATLAQPKHKGA